MIITGKIISELEDSLHTFLTPEQRVILLYWYGTEPSRFKWDKEDFIYGFHDVLRYYPDHRPKRDAEFIKKKLTSSKIPF